MQHGILPFPGDVFFMHPLRHWRFSLSCCFMCFSDTIESCLRFRCLGFFCSWNSFPYACLRERSFAWHCRCLWCFQFSSCILNDVFVFFVTRINRINSSHFFGVFEFRFLGCTFLLFSSLSGFSISCPRIKPYVIWTWCCLDFCQSLTRPHISSRRSFVQQCESCETCPRIWQISVLRRHSNSHLFVFLVLLPSWYELTCWHQCISVEWWMILLAARIIELSVQYDDDKCFLLEKNRSVPEFRVIFCFFRLKLFPIALRFSAEFLSPLTVGSRLGVGSWSS